MTAGHDSRALRSLVSSVHCSGENPDWGMMLRFKGQDRLVRDVHRVGVPEAKRTCGRWL